MSITTQIPLKCIPSFPKILCDLFKGSLGLSRLEPGSSVRMCWGQVFCKGKRIEMLQRPSHSSEAGPAPFGGQLLPHWNGRL